MKTFKVTDPKGVHHLGAHYEKGETFPASTPLSAAVNTFVHFKQVQEVKDDAKPAEEPPKGSGDPPTPPAPPADKGKGGK